MAGNRLGKTFAGGMDVYYHATGEYPDWWQGRRFRSAVKVIAAGRTAETTRDVPQLMLMGEPERWGTGCIPRSAIVRTVLGRGLTDALDTVTVMHKTGHPSTIKFKQYSQEREAFEGYDADIVWFDEEPSHAVFQEGMTRTNGRNGIVFITFTPLQGLSDVVELFYPTPTSKSRHLTRMGIRQARWDDAEGHIPDHRIEEVIESYPEHERQARADGEPTLGKGKIFKFEEKEISEKTIEVPPHFFQIGGIDFGWDHPTACIKMAEDRDNDVLHVTHAYKKSEETPLVHASWMKAVGRDWLPWSWPHDGYQHDKQSGIETAECYREEHGVYMLPTHATFESGSYGLEEGVLEMHDRFKTRRLIVDENLTEIFSEVRVYHRDEKGKIVKKRDDLLCAIRYAMMARRYGAQQQARNHGMNVVTDYDPLNPPQQAGYG